MKKKLLALFLTLCMLVGMIPATFVAADDTAVADVSAEYYVQYGATGDGSSPESPTGDLPALVAAIEAAGKTTGDTVVINVIAADGQPALDGKVTSTTGFLAYNTIAQHDVTLHFKGYGATKPIMAWSNKFAPGGANDNLYLNGPCIFEDIYLLDMAMLDASFVREIYAYGYPLEFKDGVEVLNLTYIASGTETTFRRGANHNILAGGSHGKSNSINATSVATDLRVGTMKTSYVAFDGYNLGFTMPNDVNVYIGKISVATVNLNNNTKGTYTTFNGDANLVLDGTTVSEFKTSAAGTVKGAVQVIKNNGATIAKTTLNYKDAQGNSKTTVDYDITVDTGVTLDVTETAGTYTVSGTNVAYLQSADKKTVWYAADGETITVPSAGTWTVGSAASVDAVIDAAQAPAPYDGYVFDSWTDNEDGTITANFVEKPPVTTYYVKYGATDGDGLTAETPFATVNEVIAAVKDQGIDTHGRKIDVYIIPTDVEPIYFYDDGTNEKGKEADGTTASDGLLDSTADMRYIYYFSSSLPAYKATLSFKTYDDANTDRRAALVSGTVLNAYNGSNLSLRGPVEFDGIAVIDTCGGQSRHFYGGYNDVTIKNTDFWHINGAAGTLLSCEATDKYHVLVFGIGDQVTSAHANLTNDMNIDIDGMIIGTVDTVYGNVNPAGDFNFKLSNGRATTFYMSASSKTDTTDYVVPGNFNFVLDNFDISSVVKGTKIVKVNGAVQFVKNNGSAVTLHSNFSYYDATGATKTAPDYDITVEEGITLSTTDTAGRFTVNGNRVAYAVSADVKTIYYSVDGVLTLPAGTWTVQNMLLLDDIKSAYAPTVDDGYMFTGWADNGTGTLTATIVEYKQTDYYVVYGGKGTKTGKSRDNAAATLTDVINTINADGHGEASTVTVYISNEGNGADFSENNFVGFIPGYGLANPVHKATIIFTSDPENTDTVTGSKVTFVPFVNDNENNSATPVLSGPTVLRNINLVCPQKGEMKQFAAQGHNLTIGADVKFYTQLSSRAFSEKLAYPTATGNRNAYPHESYAGNGADITIENASNLASGTRAYFTGYIGENNNYWLNIPGNNTYHINAGTLGTLAIVNAGSGITAPITFGGNVNVVLSGGAVITDLKTNVDASKVIPTVNGAYQFIFNEGSSVTNFSVNTGNAPVYKLTVNGGKLDVTPTAGQYKVADGKLAFAVSEDLTTVYYGQGVINMPAGEYTVYVVADKAEMLAHDALELSDNKPAGLEFDGWTDNNDGTLSATWTKHTPDTYERFVKYGGTGDGKTVDTPAASVEVIVDEISASTEYYKGDIIKVNVMEIENVLTENIGIKSTRDTLAKGKFTSYYTAGEVLKKTSYVPTLLITSYDYENTGKKVHLAYSAYIGANDTMQLSGPTIFENINLVRPRTCDREIVLNGFYTEFNNVTFYDTNADYYTSVAFQNLTDQGVANFYLYSYANNQAAYATGDSEIHFNSPLSQQALNNDGYHDRINIVGGCSTALSTITTPLSIYINNEDIDGAITWGNSYGQAVTMTGGLNIISNAFNSLVEREYGKSASTSVTTITGSLQIVNNNGLRFPAVPEYVNYDELFIMNSAAGSIGKLDVTDTAGTFEIIGATYAFAQTADKKTVYYGTGTITVPAGEYTVTYADVKQTGIDAVALPDDVDEYNVFDKWIDDGNGTMTASYKYQIPAYFVSAAGSDENDGLTANTAFATTAKAIEVINAGGLNAVVYLIGDVEITETAHTSLVIYDSYEDGKITNTALTPLGPVAINADLSAPLTVYTNGYGLELGGDVDTTNTVTVHLGGTGADETVNIKGKFVNALYTNTNGKTTGVATININGGTLRQLITGSAEGDYAVNSVKVNLTSGEFWSYDHVDASQVKYDSSFEFVANGNLYYFDEAKEITSGTSITEWADYSGSDSDYPDIMFNGGKFVIRSSDEENTLNTTDVAGTFSYEGNKTPYYVSGNGQTVYYGKDGKISLPVGTVDVLWADEFSADDMPTPELDPGYEFDGWNDNGSGLLTAVIVLPNFYYVSDSGSDDNVGTEAAPFKTVSKAIAKLDELGLKSGYVYIIDEATYDSENIIAFSGQITIKGVTASAVLNYTELDVKCNTKLSKLTLSGETINTNGYRLDIEEGVTCTASTVNVGGTAASPYEKLILNSGNYDVLVAQGDLVAGKTEIVLDGTTADVTVGGNTGADIKITADGANATVNVTDNDYDSLQIIANGSALGSYNNADTEKSWYIENAVADTRVDYTDINGTYGVKAPYGKLPAAVAEDGTVYVASEYSSKDATNATWYELNDYTEYINYRKPLTNTYRKLTDDKQLNVVYFGGSVTNGYGIKGAPNGYASDTLAWDHLSWRGLIGDWLKAQFPDANIKNYNRALGESGTMMGIFRTQRDIISAQPDLLFIEYSINDSYNANYTSEQKIYYAGLQYETIVREVKKALPDCDIVTVYVTDNGKIATHRNGQLHGEAQAHENVAIHYNIPSVEMGPALANKLNAADPVKDFANYAIDSVHLNEAGNYEFYLCLKEYMYNSLFCTDHSENILRNDELPAVYSDYLIDGNRQTVQATSEALTTYGSTGVTYNAGGYTCHYTAENEGYTYYGYYVIDTPYEDVLKWEFEGTDFLINGTTATVYLVSVDGGAEYEVDPAGHNPIPIASGLSSAKHTVSIRIKQIEKDSNGNSVIPTIGVFYSYDSTKNTLKGATDEYTDYTNWTLTVPAGNYKMTYLDAGTTVGDIKFGATDKIFQGWKDVEDTAVVTAGMTLVPNAVDVNDYLSVLGVQIRVGNANVKQGIRFISEKLNAINNVATVKEFGTVVIPSNFIGDERVWTDYDPSVSNCTTDVVGSEKLYVGSEHEFGGKTYYSKAVEAVNIYKFTDDGLYYTAVLTDIKDNTRFYTVKAYVTYTYNGVEYTAYTTPFRSSVYEVAKAANSQGGLSETAQGVVTDIITGVEG